MASPSPLVVKTVVVADDTEFVRERFRTAIEHAGHRAVSACNRAELLAILTRNTPRIDLIVLDLRLADGKGVELIHAIRRHGEDRPVIVFSGTIADGREVKELNRLGVSGFLNEYTGSQHIVPALAPHLFPDQHNRRSGPRVVLGIPVAYRLGNTIAAALTLNISHGGLAIRTTNPLDMGIVVKVRFRLPGATKDVDAEGRVAWAGRGAGMGLQFTQVAPADQAAIDDFVRKHFFSNRKA